MKNKRKMYLEKVIKNQFRKLFERKFLQKIGKKTKNFEKL